ncbi:MAG TPA: lipid-binding SYLF domain-containing protein [Candidatus Acidoferrales bacterium]|jgi:lipid-binding SYLF domain-containing protein|nr:lipid-binding SYLF domain-containing protein [Candidatus Acidoferrales bacterium]
MRKAIGLLLLTAMVGLPLLAADKDKDEERLRNCGVVMKEILDIPDDIPPMLLNKAQCVIVMPSVLKAAIGIGGAYGRGAMTCRSGDDFTGAWAAPTMMALEGGSFGVQLGGQATDFVILVMNDRGASSILNSKVQLGGDASAAAGPVGRDASAGTDATMRAEFLTYSRARGLFAGVALDGSTLRPDNEANERIYGKKLSAKDIALHGAVPAPESGRQLLGVLQNHSPNKK